MPEQSDDDAMDERLEEERLDQKSMEADQLAARLREEELDQKLNQMFGSRKWRREGKTVSFRDGERLVEIDLSDGELSPLGRLPGNRVPTNQEITRHLLASALMGDKASPLGGEVSRGWNSPLRLRLNALKMSAVDLTNRLVSEGGVKKSAEQVRRYITGVSVPHNEIKEQISAIVALPVLHLWPNAEGYAPPEPLGATIPLFGAAEAGFGMDISVMSEPIDQIAALGSLGEDTYAVVVRGESMEPRLEAGDYVYCDPSATFKRGHTVVVQFTDSSGTMRGVVKEFVKRTVGKDRNGHKAWGVTVRQHNPDEEYEIQNVQKVSRVVHVKYQ